MDISARVLELAAGHKLHSGDNDSSRLPAALEYADRQWEQMVNAWCSRMFASAPARTFDFSSPAAAPGNSPSGQGNGKTVTGGTSDSSGRKAAENAATRSNVRTANKGNGATEDKDSPEQVAADAEAAAQAQQAHAAQMALIEELAFTQEVKAVLGLQTLLVKDADKEQQRLDLVKTAWEAARLMRVLPLDTSSGMRLIARTMSLGMLFYAGGKADEFGIYLRARGPEIDAALKEASEQYSSAAGSAHDADNACGNASSDNTGEIGSASGSCSCNSTAVRRMAEARFGLLCEIFQVWREMFSFSEKLNPTYLHQSHRTFNEHLKAAADLVEHCTDEQQKLNHALYLAVFARCRAATCALLDMEDSDEPAPAQPVNNEIDWDAVGNAFEEDSSGWGPADAQHCAIAPGGDRELACSQFTEALENTTRIEDHELEVTIRALRTMVKLA